MAFAADCFPGWVGEETFGTAVGVRFTRGLDAKTLAELGPHLEQLRSIKTLSFGWDGANTTFPELSPLPNLERLTLTMFGSAGMCVGQFRHSPRLKNLAIAGMNLGDDWSVFSEGWRALDDLAIVGLDDAGAESLAKHVRKLSSLHLHNSSLSEPGLRAITGIPGLQRIVLSDSVRVGRGAHSDFLQREQRITELLPQAEVIAHWH